MTRNPRERSSQRRIEAPAPKIFDILGNIDNHAALDGAGMLTGRPEGPRPLILGSRFTMGMEQGRVPYRSVNTVVEFEPDRLIAWRTVGEFNGHALVGGQRWRYRLTPTADGATVVRESYDWSGAKLPRLTIEMPGYPRRMEWAMALSLQRLEALVNSGTTGDAPAANE